MANPTTNYGWVMPTSASLVTNLPADFNTFGQGVDTSMQYLLGGTTGQVLSKTSGTNMAFTWVTPTDQTPLTTKGDLFTFTTVDARLAVGANGTSLVADSAQTTGLGWSATPGASNPVINSAFNVWQRGTSISLTASSGVIYTADRWATSTNANQACTVARQATGDTTNLPSIQYAMRYQRNSGQTGTGLLLTTQSLETINSIPFAGKTVTVSFYARAGANFSSASSVLVNYLMTGTGTDQNRQSGAYTGEVTGNNNATLTTTWQRFSYTYSVAATATEIATGFAYTPVGTASTNDYYEVTGVQIDIGSVALPFRTAGVSYQQELALCQRYLPSLINSTNAILGFGKNTSQTAVLYKFPVTARVTPTGITTTTVSTDFYIYNQSFTTGRPSAISFDFAGTDMAVLATTHTAGSPLIALGQPTMLGISSGSGSILFTGCEL